MAQIFAVGNRSFVAALAGVGAEPVRCDDRAAFETALRRLAIRKDARMVFVPEPSAIQSAEVVAAFRKRSPAALLALPPKPSDRHPALEDMRRLIEQATGASLV